MTTQAETIMITCTSLVTRPRGSWRWQNRYGINTYVAMRSATSSTGWRWALAHRGPDIASVGRSRRKPDVATDYAGKVHGTEVTGAFADRLCS
jgi:hypothetical protein